MFCVLNVILKNETPLVFSILGWSGSPPPCRCCAGLAAAPGSLVSATLRGGSRFSGHFFQKFVVFSERHIALTSARERDPPQWMLFIAPRSSTARVSRLDVRSASPTSTPPPSSPPDELTTCARSAEANSCSNRRCSVTTKRSWVAVGAAVERGSVSLR